MRIFPLVIFIFIGSYSFGQMRAIDKVYIVEGVMADRETLEVIPSAILYNDSLGITTTSDERGYFKIVVPYELIRTRNTIPINIIKSGYKNSGSGITYNPSPNDTIQSNIDHKVIWNFDVKIFWLAKIDSELSPTVSACVRVKDGVFNVASILDTYNEYVESERREEKFDKLKEGNDRVYFRLGNETGLATGRSDIIVFGKLKYVYLDGKKIMLNQLNRFAKRSSCFYDREHSDVLTKKLGKETIALTTKARQNDTPDQFHFIKAILEIEIEK